MAVDKRYKRRGIGQNLLLWAIGKAYEISRQIGCRYITVDAKRESIDFYLEYEFKIVKKHENRNFPPMYFNIYSADKKDKQNEPALNEANAIDEERLRVIGIDALNKALGPEKALRFLTLFLSEPTCCIEISKMLYKGQSVDEIFKRVREHWRG